MRHTGRVRVLQVRQGPGDPPQPVKTPGRQTETADGALEDDASGWVNLAVGRMGVFPLLKSLLPVVVAFLLPTTDTLDHRRVGNGTHRHGLFQEPMEELPAMA